MSGRAPTGVIVLRASCAVVGAHVLVRELLVLEPGADRADHVFAVVIPAAVLAAIAYSAPGMRTGVRAAASLALGPLALVGGGLAIGRLGAEGFDASAVTGFLLLPAGVVLLLTGARDLWTARRRDGRLLLRRTLLFVVGLLFLYWVEVPIMLALVATHRPAAATEAVDLGWPAQQVTVPTTDGLDLSASWVPSGNGAAVVTFPDRSWTEVQSRMLAEAGYGVLALDMRGYGDSEGDPDAFGWGSAADIDAGVAWLRDRQGIDRVAGLGLSVGGEQMIEAAASNPDLAAVVAEGPGERSVKETLLFGAAGLPALPHAFVMTAATAIFSGDAPPPALDDSAAAISPRGLFVITAENGQGGEELGRDYYDAAGPPRRFWEVPGADHTGGIGAAPGEYRRRVLTFFGRTLDPPR